MTIAIILITAIAFLHLLIGMQIQWSELKLFSRKYNYRIGSAQYVTYTFALVALVLSFLEFSHGALILSMLACTTALAIVAISEWVLSLLNPKTALISWMWRLCVCFLIVTLIVTVLRFQLIAADNICFPSTAFLLAGLYLRNTPFGICHGKDLWIARLFDRSINADFSQFTNSHDITALCEYAGCKEDYEPESIFNVADYGVKANSRHDQTAAIQHVIDLAGKNGGGRVFFPKGRYLLNKKGGSFLQINYSNITIEGETDKKGNPLAEIVNCGTTIRGHKNPWISPFMITTGEALQPSNEFWGLQFRKKKDNFSRSNSLSDPGSDGNILTPEFSTRVIADSEAGDTILHVEDSSKLSKYIMLGMYNTTKEGNLIHDILGMETLREEWAVANRAGEEEAPSYQWLAEVKSIIDDHTIELSRPLLRKCSMTYEPALFNVDMLEHITIRDLRISSTWNGLFRHHGFPLYYSIPRTQQMDYGWNAINMKRVAHGRVSNLIIKDFSNPLYVMDSRNVTIQDVEIKGYDGHQGLKIYVHACDNLFENITFENHFADMMGGEGNAYANVFRNIEYRNPVFKPVDYDFHGFSEAPMSPPADNIFTHIYGFRYMKSAGAITHLPSCAQNNIWHETITEGEKEGDYLFYAMTYRQKKGLIRFITAIGYSVAIIQKTHNLSPVAFAKNVKGKLKAIDETGIQRSKHKQLFPKSFVYGINTQGIAE